MRQYPWIWTLILFTVFQIYMRVEHGAHFDFGLIAFMWVIVLAFENHAERIEKRRDF